MLAARCALRSSSDAKKDRAKQRPAERIDTLLKKQRVPHRVGICRREV